MLRRFLVLPLFLLLLPIASAQLEPRTGEVLVELRPRMVEVVPDQPRTVAGWMNATITCESNYAPQPLQVEVSRDSLEDEEDQQVWSVEPSTLSFTFLSVGGSRFEARREVSFAITTVPSPVNRTGKIEFVAFDSGGSIGSQDCGFRGTTWRFAGEPYIDVTSPAASTDNGSIEEPASQPIEAMPAEFVVEDGPVRGESHVPTEAFWSMGIVVSAFAAILAQGVWRRRLE